MKTKKKKELREPKTKRQCYGMFCTECVYWKGLKEGCSHFNRWFSGEQRSNKASKH